MRDRICAAIVTGVSRGLGEALALAMVERGGAVLGVGRSASARLGRRFFRPATCDLAHPERLAASLAPALRERAAARPGIFGTGMQAFMRRRDPAAFPSLGRFRSYHESGRLKDPAELAAKIDDRLVPGRVENGRTCDPTDR